MRGPDTEVERLGQGEHTAVGSTLACAYADSTPPECPGMYAREIRRLGPVRSLECDGEGECCAVDRSGALTCVDRLGQTRRVAAEVRAFDVNGNAVCYAVPGEVRCEGLARERRSLALPVAGAIEVHLQDSQAALCVLTTAREIRCWDLDDDPTRPVEIQVPRTGEVESFAMSDVDVCFLGRSPAGIWCWPIDPHVPYDPSEIPRVIARRVDLR